MKTNNTFIYCNALLVNQFTNNQIVVTTMRFLDLLEIVKFTHREPQDFDPFEIGHNTGGSKVVDADYYQRLVNDDRTRKIANFLLKELSNKQSGKTAPIGTFATSMILAADLFDTNEMEGVSFSDFIQSSDENAAVLLDKKLCSDGDSIDVLTIPRRKVALIVDGQHRLAGMGRLYHDAKANNVKVGRQRMEEVYPFLDYEYIIKEIESFQFQCTLLLNFDLWEQGRVFADVNFNQKPVNRSLYYDIFGSYPDPNHNDIYLLHRLTQHLNTNTKSVLRNKIKMLGNGTGYFSQAFIVEALLPLFRKNNIWEDLAYDYLHNGEKYKFLPQWFRAYFSAIKELFIEYWPGDELTSSRQYKHILVKTTGMGALIKLVENIYKIIKDENDQFENMKEEELKDRIIEVMRPVSKKAKDFFSSTGNYSRGTGKGLQNKLYQEMVELIQKNSDN